MTHTHHYSRREKELQNESVESSQFILKNKKFKVAGVGRGVNVPGVMRIPDANFAQQHRPISIGGGKKKKIK
jgi:hypothetical protein